MNPVMMQAIETLVRQRSGQWNFVVGNPPPEDNPDRWKFFAVFVGVTFREGNYFENYVDLEAAPWSPIGEHQQCNADDLDKYESDGIRCALLFDPSRCDWAAYMKTWYYSTPEGTPEREREVAEHAAVWPEELEQNIYLWRDIRPGGQFLAYVKARQGANQQAEKGAR